MKKSKLLPLILLLLFAISSTAFGQDVKEEKDQTIRIENADGNSPIYILVHKEKSLKIERLEGEKDFLSGLDPDLVSKVTVLKGESAIAVYGEKGQDGVVIIEFKEKSFSSLPKDIQRKFKKLRA